MTSYRINCATCSNYCDLSDEDAWLPPYWRTEVVFGWVESRAKERNHCSDCAMFVRAGISIKSLEDALNKQTEDPLQIAIQDYLKKKLQADIIQEVDENVKYFRKLMSIDSIKKVENPAEEETGPNKLPSVTHIMGPNDKPLVISNKVKKCRCDSKDLFQYGCRCHGS